MTVQVGTRVRINDSYASSDDDIVYKVMVAVMGREFAEDTRQRARNATVGKTGVVSLVRTSDEDPWPYAVDLDGEGRLDAVSDSEFDVLEEQA